MSNELYLKYAEVIKMCECTKLENTPWVCVKWRGSPFVVGHPKFINPLEEYEFALAIVEDKPVFFGDNVFVKDNKYPYVNWENFEYWKNQVKVLSKAWTWQEPKKKFKLEGYEFPCPNEVSEFWSLKSLNRIFIIDNNNIFLFDTEEEAKLVKDTLIRIFKDNLK